MKDPVSDDLYSPQLSTSYTKVAHKVNANSIPLPSICPGGRLPLPSLAVVGRHLRRDSLITTHSEEQRERGRGRETGCKNVGGNKSVEVEEVIPPPSPLPLTLLLPPLCARPLPPCLSLPPSIYRR